MKLKGKTLLSLSLSLRKPIVYVTLVLLIFGTLFNNFNDLNIPKAKATESSPTYPGLEHDNTTNARLNSSDGTYLYGYTYDPTNGDSIVRKHEADTAYETMSNVKTVLGAGYTIREVYATTTSGLILVTVADASSNYYMYRSTDGGATLSDDPVFTFGESNGTAGANSNNIYILKGFSEVKVNYPGTNTGIGDLYIGEYNINTSRTVGGANDRVRIMKSTDDGQTWDAIMTWNTIGNQVRHVHSIQQDPYTGYMYVTTGDGTTMNNIIRWDGVSSWSSNNTAGADINNWPGFKCISGLERYRTTQLIFDENYYYSFTDSVGVSQYSELGIWKGAKDLSSFVRVNSDVIDYDNYHVGWYGENINGTLIFTTSPEYVDGTHRWTKNVAQIYTSSDGDNWKAVSYYNFFREPNSSLRIEYLFQAFGKLYINNTSGVRGGWTDILYVNGTVVSTDALNIVHPVYYVGNWGTVPNSSDFGYSKETSRDTLGNMLQFSNWLANGSRIRVASGTYTSVPITPDFRGEAFTAAAGFLSTVIEGQGKSSTIIRRGLFTENNSLMSINATNTKATPSAPLIIKNLTMSNIKAGSDAYVLQLQTGGGVELQDVQVGDIYETDADLISVGTGASFTAKKSSFTGRTNGTVGNCIGLTGTGSSAIRLEYSILNNCVNGVKQKYAGTTLTILNSVFKNYSNRGVLIDSDVTVAPTIKNTVFEGQATKNAIEDLSGLTETNVDYNTYSVANINVTDGGHSLATGTDVKLKGGTAQATGTVTRANMQSSYVNGMAFADFTVAGTLTSNIGKRITVIDAAGKLATGYIGTTGTGQTEVELVTVSDDRDFTSDTTFWTKGAGWTISGGVAAHSGGLTQISRANLLTLGGRYKVKTDNNSTVYAYYGSNFSTISVGTGTNNIVYGNAWQSTTSMFGSNTTTNLDNISVKQITTPSATGVTIVSSAGGSTQNWEYIESGFNYGDTADYTYKIDSPYDFSAESGSPLIDAGVDVGLTSDFANSPVPQGDGPDIGAYEYGMPADPVLQSTACPIQSAWCGDSTPDISVTVDDPSLHYHYLVNQTAVPLKADVEAGGIDADGTFIVGAGVIDSDGVWYVHMIAQDADGYFSTNFGTYVIKYDGTSPIAFDLSSPTHSFITNNNNPTFAWDGTTDVSSDLDEYDLYIDESLNKSVDSVTTSTTPPTALAEGEHTWYVKARDNAGNTTDSTSTFAITIDTASPSIVISDPVADLFTSHSTYTIKGTITDAISGVDASNVTINGVAIASPASFATAVNLNIGLNTFTIIAKDNAGNTTTTLVNITRTEIPHATATTTPTTADAIRHIFSPLTGTSTSTTPAIEPAEPADSISMIPNDSLTTTAEKTANEPDNNTNWIWIVIGTLSVLVLSFGSILYYSRKRR